MPEELWIQIHNIVKDEKKIYKYKWMLTATSEGEDICFLKVHKSRKTFV